MRGKRWMWAVAGVVVAAGAIWFGRGPVAMADIGAHFAAKQTCSCLLVSGRTMESCLRDLDPMIQRYARFQTTSIGVHASIFGVFNGEARYEPGFGCRPVK